jgi:hypothetical protein
MVTVCSHENFSGSIKIGMGMKIREGGDEYLGFFFFVAL